MTNSYFPKKTNENFMFDEIKVESKLYIFNIIRVFRKMSYLRLLVLY